MVDGGGCAWVSLFGHVHEARGSTLNHTEAGDRFLANCAVANDGMRVHAVVAPATVFDLAPAPPPPPTEIVAAAPPTRILDASGEGGDAVRQQLKLGSDPNWISLDSHCLVVPSCAPPAIAAAAELLAAEIAALSGVRLLAIPDGLFAHNREFHLSPENSSTRCRTPLVVGCSAAWLVKVKLLSQMAADELPVVGGWWTTPLFLPVLHHVHFLLPRLLQLLLTCFITLMS